MSRASSAACYTVAPMARQRLGQHFLADANWREQIARAIRVSPHSMAPGRPSENSCWIEIGAGHGEMTEQFLSIGVPVYAIEIDPRLIASLQRLAQKFPKLTVVPGDILKTDLAAIAEGRRMHIYGCLLYTSPSPRDLSTSRMPSSA